MEGAKMWKKRCPRERASRKRWYQCRTMPVQNSNLLKSLRWSSWVKRVPATPYQLTGEKLTSLAVLTKQTIPTWTDNGSRDDTFSGTPSQAKKLSCQNCQSLRGEHIERCWKINSVRKPLFHSSGWRRSPLKATMTDKWLHHDPINETSA